MDIIHEIIINCTEIEMYNLSRELERIIIDEPEDDFDQCQETRKLYMFLKDNLSERENNRIIIIKSGNYDDLPAHLQREIDLIRENANKPIPHIVFSRANLQQKIKNILLGKPKYSEVMNIPHTDAKPPKKPCKQY